MLMPTRLHRALRSRESEVVVAALLTLAAVATVSADAPAHADGYGQSTIRQPAVTADDVIPAVRAPDTGLPDKGLPPSPGPNNPNGLTD